MFAFCLQSLLREYGWQFLGRVALPHPIRTVRAAARALRLAPTAQEISLDRLHGIASLSTERWIVGVGFCLKPLAPPCPSGRFNHDCQYLDVFGTAVSHTLSQPCRSCAIRHIGLMALRSGSAFYIMTSAKEILLDIFMPALNRRLFTTGIFALCRYSFQPFATGLLAAGVKAWLLPFSEGDCADYTTWLRADVGIKPDRTALSSPSQRRIIQQLTQHRPHALHARQFIKRGHVFYPQTD